MRKILPPVATVGVLATALAYVAKLPPDEKPMPEPELVPENVEVVVLEPIPAMPDTFELTAVVEPNRVVDVCAEVAARVERIAQREETRQWRGQTLPAGTALDEGEPINEGAPILYLNTDLLQAQYERAQAQYLFDQAEYERVAELYRQGVASETELNDKRARRDVSRATRDEALEELERATVVAPVSGILNSLPMELGEYATPGTCVAEIVDIDPVKVVVNIPERDVHYLSLGDEVEIFARAPQQLQRVGRITYISELSDESTRTTRVEVAVDNPEHTLRSGQIVHARLTRRVLHNVIMIPLRCVIPLEVGYAAYVVDDEGNAQRRLVEIGFIKGRSVRIHSGLSAGDRLIIEGHRYVGPGQPVRIVEEADAS